MKNAKAKTKVDMPKTPKDAMAPAKVEEDENHKNHMGECDLDCLMKAHEIQMNPDKMKYVEKAHGKKMAAMRSIADLKLASKALFDKEQEEEKAKMNKPFRLRNKKEV